MRPSRSAAPGASAPASEAPTPRRTLGAPGARGATAERARPVRLVAWNIRAGGGRRAIALAAQLRYLRADVAALSEFRGTPPSAGLAQALARSGLVHQLTTTDPAAPNVNCLLVASRWPLTSLPATWPPRETGRWLLAQIEAPHPFAVGAMHVPNRVTGRKWAFLDAVLGLAEGWRGGPAVLLGDTNSGRPGIDEESPGFNEREGAWMEGLDRAGWRDAFRHLHGPARAYTWYSPNAGNGFRIDQAFLNPALLPRLLRVQHSWGRREDTARHATHLSDHAALVLDLRDPDPATLDVRDAEPAIRLSGPPVTRSPAPARVTPRPSRALVRRPA